MPGHVQSELILLEMMYQGGDVGRLVGFVMLFVRAHVSLTWRVLDLIRFFQRFSQMSRITLTRVHLQRPLSLSKKKTQRLVAHTVRMTMESTLQDPRQMEPLNLSGSAGNETINFDLANKFVARRQKWSRWC